MMSVGAQDSNHRSDSIEHDRRLNLVRRRVLVSTSGEVRAGWRLALFIALLVALTGIVFLLIHFAPALVARGSLAARTLRIEFLQFAAVLVATVLMSKLERRPLARYGAGIDASSPRQLIVGMAFGFLSLTLLLELLHLHHNFVFGSLALSPAAMRHFAILWGVAFLGVGLFEEFLMRGYTLYTLTSGIGFWPAAIALSVLFGAMHIGNTGESWLGVCAAMGIGLFFSLTVRRTGSLWWAIGFHWIWDYSESFIYATPDSGQVAPGHLLNSSFSGSRWLTGGSVGPEASVLVFPVIGILFLVFHWLYPTATYPRTNAPVAQPSPSALDPL